MLWFYMVDIHVKHCAQIVKNVQLQNGATQKTNYLNNDSIKETHIGDPTYANCIHQYAQLDVHVDVEAQTAGSRFTHKETTGYVILQKQYLPFCSPPTTCLPFSIKMPLFS